jgi:tetratricopeptide (TPR) repeat protein
MIALRIAVATMMFCASPHATKAQHPLVEVGVVPSDWTDHGRALAAVKRHREAIAAFERALQSGGSPPEQLAWRIARSYAEIDNKKQAVRWAERASDLGFDVREPIRRAPEFAKYLDDPRVEQLLKPLDVSKGRVAVLTSHF